MNPVIFSFPGNELISEKIRIGLNGEKGNFILHKFPDDESYVRILTDVERKDIIVVCTLSQPDSKIIPLFFLCKLLKVLNAKTICLVTPYLSYMRQDKAFNKGEAVTSVYFAELISSFVDRLITVDPHLHRRSSLNEIYSIPCQVLHTNELISKYIEDHIPNALLIGPDSESKQWVSEIAFKANVPFIVLNKIRTGDSSVTVSLPEIKGYENRIPVLVDDIISTAKTMIEALKNLHKLQTKTPVCIAVHAIFALDSYNELSNSGVKEIITSNTIFHETNKIDISPKIIEILKKN
ncbi:MAG TPA: ribose-phosphate diphosphokinase [Bacteroidia bacterium]|nr:ribose-phosphate diphosphokinase [Bacteroidia bacterium]